MRYLMILESIALMVFLISKPGFSNLQNKLSYPEPEIGIIEHLGEFAPLDLTFLDEKGDSVVLNQLITKPTVLSLVYFNCPGICSPLLSGVVDVLDRMDLKPGEDYQAVTISFDPTDTPKLAADKKHNYMKAFRLGPFPEEQWKWLTGDSVSIEKFTKAVGFRYKKEGRDYVHAGAIIVLAADGKISRYLRGIEFQPFDLKMAITEASQGRTGPTITKVLLYCFSYDPEGKKYVFNFTKVGGTIFLVSLLAFIAFLTIKKKSQRGEREVTDGE